jgi:hypothetical protein
VHSDRYKVVKQVEVIAKQAGLRTYFYFYSPSKILFFFQKLLKKEFKNIEKHDVSFIPLSKSNVLDIIKKSKTIIDIQHPSQSGLTMRTLEMLGAKRKLITTNKHIEEYDFYDKNNVLVIDRNQTDINMDFLKSKFQNIDENIYYKYSLNSWLSHIFL